MEHSSASYLNWFDLGVMAAVNQWVGIAPAFDGAVRLLADWHFFRCAPLVAVLLWAWFDDEATHVRGRFQLGLAAVVCVTMTAKAMQFILPVHTRPFATAADLGLKMPAGLAVDWGYGSCFPSDTATLHFALAALIWSVSRGWGMAATAWVAIVVAIPRVYLLYHWPSDIIGAVMLAFGGVALLQSSVRANAVAQHCAEFADRKPQVFYPIFFLVLYQCVDSFYAFDFVTEQFKHAARVGRI